MVPLDQVAPEFNPKCVRFLLQTSRNVSPATFSCSSCASGTWSSSHGTQVIILHFNGFIFLFISTSGSFVHFKSRTLENPASSVFPAVLFFLDPLQLLGEFVLSIEGAERMMSAGCSCVTGAWKRRVRQHAVDDRRGPSAGIKTLMC